MTKAKINAEIKGFHDKPGGLIYRQMSDGITLVSRTSDSSEQKSSRGQQVDQHRFQKAARYARWAAKAHPIYAELVKGTKKSAYSLARSDWFNPPTIHEVQLAENKIGVRATDNVMVTRLVIRVLDEQGKLLEAGEASRREGDWWEYIFHTMGKTFTIEAWDLPGNVTKLVL